MPQTQVSCPNCRQPVVADVNQVFDTYVDPTAKQRLLSGTANMIQCQMCGYQGMLATPIIYHDQEKELLLTFIPPEVNMPYNERERLLGSLINQVVNNLPQEQRKAYLLQPQETLTMQGLVERVLEEDGITREMIQAQQERLGLIQRLASTSTDDVRTEIAQQEDAMIDAEFFALLRNLVEAAIVSGDQQSAALLTELQQFLIPITTFGKEVQEQSQEVEAAVNELRALGDDLTRENMLKLIVDAPSETRLQAYVSLARPVLDYSFFQLLSERIDKSRGEGRSRLVELRTELLAMTQEIDRQIEEHQRQTRELIESILQVDDVPGAMAQVMPAVDEFFVQELNRQLEEARGQGDLEKSGKLQQMMDVIQQASAPPEFGLVQDYLDQPDETSRQQFLEANADSISSEFTDMLANITAQAQSSEDQQIIDHVMAANRQALRFSMERSFRG